MDTPVSKSSKSHGLVPVNLFFRGLDFKFKQDRSVTPPSPARVQIVRARQEQISELRHLVAKFQRTVQATLDADQHGFAEAPADLLVILGEEITAKAQQLYQDIQDARTRFLSPSVVVGADSDPDRSAAPVTMPPAAAVGMVVTAKPTDIHYPTNMAEAAAIGKAKRGQVNGFINPVFRMGRP